MALQTYLDSIDNLSHRVIVDLELLNLGVVALNLLKWQKLP